MHSNIPTSGITPLNQYPPIANRNLCKHIMQRCMLSLPADKPSISYIENLYVHIDFEEFNILNTILGPKVVIYGNKFIKILYTASNAMQSMHSSSWLIPFCSEILLPNISGIDLAHSISSIFIGTEGGSILYSDKRKLDVCIFGIFYPVFFKNPTNTLNKANSSNENYNYYCDDTTSCYTYSSNRKNRF